MEKMTFREAQLLLHGADRLRKFGNYELNESQTFQIGDVASVVAICLDKPAIVVELANGAQSYCNIHNFSDMVIDECVQILREAAFELDSHFLDKEEYEQIYNPKHIEP